MAPAASKLGPQTRAAMGAAAAKARPGRFGKLLGSGLARGAGTFGALFAIERLLGQWREAKGQRQEIQEILEEAGGGGITPLGPMHTMEFIEAMGPEFLAQLSQDPALALELQERLQSAAMSGLPAGAAVLRSGQPGTMDMRAVLEQLGG